MGLYTEKTEISQFEYHMLIGLLEVSKQHSRSLDIIKKSVAQILGEKNDIGHAGDAIWGDYSADQLLEKSEIKVTENANS